MDRVNTVLRYLDDAGIGNPKRINDLLRDMYPHPDQFDNDNEYFTYAGRIENFLNELQNANLLKYRIEGFFRVKMQGKYFTLDDCIIMASITYEGSKSLEPMIPNQTNFSATFNAPFAGNFNQSSSSNVTQSTNEESTESKELIKRTLEDLPKNKWYRHWGFIVAVIGILVAIAIALLS